MSRQVTAHSRRRKTRRSTADKSRPSRFVLVGDPARSDQVQKALKNLDMVIVRTDEQRPRLDRATLGVAIVTPRAARAYAARAVSTIRKSPHGRALPLFAIVEDDTTDRVVRQLYAEGATAVFRWPREAPGLARLMAELLGVAMVRGRPKRPQAALTRTIKAHLRVTPWFTTGVRVKTVGSGEVHVSGFVSTFQRKRSLERLIAEVPGVKRVVSHDLWVQPSELTDRQIAAGARSVLRNTTKVDDATVSVAAHAGTVTLAGTVADRRELERIVDLISNVRGVRDIKNLLVVSVRAKRRDQTVAARLRGAISKWFPHARVEVAVFAGVAVLSGRVPRLSRRLVIEGIVNQDPFVTRVVNKIEIV